MTKVVTADEIALGAVNLLSGTVDPSAGGGVARALGSQYERSFAGNSGIYSKTGAAATAWTKLAQSLSWKSVLDYGALGDDATDATAAFQQASDDVEALGGGIVWVPPGTYRVSQLTLSASVGVQFWGAGASSVIKWTFNAATAAGSMVTVTAAARACVFDSLRFDGSLLTNPAASRDNHLLLFDGAGGGVIECHVVNCTFGGMVAASGDGVHVVGTAGNLVSRLWIHDNEFDGCSRFGVGCTQGWQYGWVLGNFLTNCETEIGIVATANVNTDSIQIQDNELVHTNAVRHALRLEGDATGLITRMICAKNIISGGFVALANIQYGQFGGNSVFSGAFASTDGVVRLSAAISDFLCCSNVVDREVGSSAGPVIEALKATGAPTRFGIKSNLLINEIATSSLIALVDCARFQVSNNECRSSDAGATAIDGIDIQAVTVALVDAMITGNQVTAAAGTFRSAIRLLANGANVSGSVLMGGNQANQLDVGVRYEIGGGGGNFTGSVILQGNNALNAATADFANVNGSAVIPRVGFNAGTLGANLYEGDGSPEGVVTARIGSMYLRRDGGQATAVYYKEAGTGNTGWIGIGGAPLFWGVGDAGTVATALFMAPGYIAAAGATEIKIAVTRPGTIRNLRVQVAGAGTDAGAVTFTVRKNGVDTALTCALDNTATGAASDLTHSFTVVAGDLLSISILKAGAVTAGQTNAFAAVELI